MTITRQYTKHSGIKVPKIEGAGGGGKGGATITKNSLFSTDIMFVTVGLGEGPVYRINPNGPQDIEIQDGGIEDLILMKTTGEENTDQFKTAIAYGTTTQDPLPYFGDATVTPQQFASPVTLKYGNLAGVPASSVTYQSTSAAAWDALNFIFIVNLLFTGDDKGNVWTRSLTINIKVYDSTHATLIADTNVVFAGKTDTPYKRSVELAIPENYRSDLGYTFDITKITGDSEDPKVGDSISVIGWDEIENTKQAYPRTALIGYALKAANEHTGGVPNFTSLIKGLIIKVPSNYNQPILANGEIDWRQLELPESGTNSYVTNGYSLQKTGSGTNLTALNPQIYVGTWDGAFVYSWTQNPVWIVYDILTNTTYGLGISPENIDKYKFYQIAMYCDACNPVTGKFIGVDGLADGTFRYKPKGMYTSIRENQIGLPNSTAIKERRFISDISIVDQEKSMDMLNKIAATFRAILVYAGGKISLAVDMPEEYPVMLFTEANIKKDSFQISGNKESDIFTGVDVTYIEPSNHFKRETLRVNTVDANDGTDSLDIENIASIDLFGVTRRSQAMRTAQYHIASSKYLRRNVSLVSS